MGWVMGLMRNRGGMSAVAARFVGGHFSAGIAFAAIVILLFSPRALFGETREREVSMTVRYKQAKRLLVLVVGTTVLLLGLVLLVLPGPGLITIALGLSILASECVWARQILKRFRQWLSFLRMPRRPFCTPRDRASKPRFIQGLYRFRATLFRRR